MRLRSLVVVPAAVIGAIVAACGGKTDDPAPPPAASADAGKLPAPPPPPVDAGDAGIDIDPRYPAPHPPMPLVKYQGGNILRSIKVVNVFFPGDAMKGRLTAFTEMIVKSDWWTQTSSEYCVDAAGTDCIGKGSVLAHVERASAPKARYTPVEVEDLLREMVASGEVPAPQPDVVYSLYFPRSVSIGESGFESCRDFGGYHSSTDVTAPGGGTSRVAYAVMVRCTSAEAEQTVATAHELIEAATDPVNETPNMIGGFVMEDEAFASFFLAEVGDLCVREELVDVGGFAVQRSWSNKAAKAGTNPCVPISPKEKYFNAAPAVQEVKLAVGESITIDVIPFAESKVPNWDLEAQDIFDTIGGVAALDLSLDKGEVNNGTKTKLTITLVRKPKAGENPYGTGIPYALVSRRGGEVHMWAALVRPK